MYLNNMIISMDCNVYVCLCMADDIPTKEITPYLSLIEILKQFTNYKER